jgi:hypothetical protein
MPQPQDPPDWKVTPQQTVTITLPVGVKSADASSAAEAQTLDVWKSCTGWRYPADDDTFMLKQAPLSVSAAVRIPIVLSRLCNARTVLLNDTVSNKLVSNSSL